MALLLPVLSPTRIHNNATASAETFFTGDGTASSGQLVDQYGFPIKANANVTAMHQTDWQGRVALYNTARTNYVQNSDAIGDAYWGTHQGGTGTITVTPNYAAGPDGAMTASRVQASKSASGDLAYITGTATVPISDKRPRQVSFWAKSNTGSTQGVGASVAGTAINYVNVGTSWVKVASLVFTPSSAFGNIAAYFGLFYSNAVGSVDVLVAACDAYYTDVSYGVHIKTASSSVTVTDYTATSSGAVTFGQVPASGATVDWDGTGTSVG